MLEQLATWLVNLIGNLGYGGIILLMAVESSAIPFPSEVVMPPAGYLVYKGEMNLWLALGSGILGSLIGAYVNYVVAQKVGRWFFIRYGKWFLLKEATLVRAEKYFADHGEITTFVCRLLPGIRQLISIPAGLANMPLGRFFAWTSLGSGLWCAVLVAIGWLIGKAGGDPRSRALISQYSHRVLWIVLPCLVVLVVGYVIWHRRRARLAPGGASAGQG